MNETPPTEAEVRKLRDQVYGHPSSDKNWKACRDNWMQPASVAWLRWKAKAKARNNLPIV